MVWSSRPSRAKALALTALALTAACGTGRSPGVSVTSADSDVVFGNPTPTPAAPTSSGGFVPQPPGGTIAPPVPFPSLGGFNDSPPPFEFPTPAPPVTTDICPGPALYAQAPTAATTFVQGQPKAGYYFWQVITSEDLGNKIKKVTPRYTNYQVRNVSSITSTPNPQGGDPTTTFTYDVVEPVGKGDTLTFTYQVKQNAPGQSVNNPVGNPVRVSTPDAGVAISKEVLADSTGKEIASFSPLTPVLILPLPIIGGASFTGSGTDPLSGATLTVQGTVKGPDRVATCDSYVQGFRVDATSTSNGAQGQAGSTVAQTFTIETQSGALLVGNVQTPSNSTVTTSSIVGDDVARAAARAIPAGRGL